MPVKALKMSSSLLHFDNDLSRLARLTGVCIFFFPGCLKMLERQSQKGPYKTAALKAQIVCTKT